ncbi:MAG: LuxR C-terminal-related transcriptional regulator [Fimbriimonadales bacterium]|nr:LuxR C-terminal-related transcriptional regulator [Fimbriimonadales bacterium]
MSEETYERKRRRHGEVSLETGYGVDRDQPPDMSELLLPLIEACEYLTTREQYILRRMLEGATQEEIGREYGITKQAVSKTYRKAVAKVQLRVQLTPYDDIGEVYRELVSRGGNPSDGRNLE